MRIATDDMILNLASLGVIVSSGQLIRWSKADLGLTRPLSHGRGRARGVEHLWDSYDIPRIIIIALAIKQRRSFVHVISVLRACGL